MSELERLRADISGLDRQILEAVNRRVEVVREIREHKRANGIDFLDPRRERELVDALVEANEGPLSADGVRELFAEVLALVKRETAS